VQLRALSDLVATQLDINKLNIVLGSQSGGGGLFAEVVSPDGTVGSALESKINVLNLISTPSPSPTMAAACDQGLDLLGIKHPGRRGRTAIDRHRRRRHRATAMHRCG
jgi:hypothetical protein